MSNSEENLEKIIEEIRNDTINWKKKKSHFIEFSSQIKQRNMPLLKVLLNNPDLITSEIYNLRSDYVKIITHLIKNICEISQKINNTQIKFFCHSILLSENFLKGLASANTVIAYYSSECFENIFSCNWMDFSKIEEFVLFNKNNKNAKVREKCLRALQLFLGFFEKNYKHDLNNEIQTRCNFSVQEFQDQKQNKNLEFISEYNKENKNDNNRNLKKNYKLKFSKEDNKEKEINNLEENKNDSTVLNLKGNSEMKVLLQKIKSLMELFILDKNEEVRKIAKNLEKKIEKLLKKNKKEKNDFYNKKIFEMYMLNEDIDIKEKIKTIKNLDVKKFCEIENFEDFKILLNLSQKIKNFFLNKFLNQIIEKIDHKKFFVFLIDYFDEDFSHNNFFLVKLKKKILNFKSEFFFINFFEKNDIKSLDLLLNKLSAKKEKKFQLSFENALNLILENISNSLYESIFKKKNLQLLELILHNGFGIFENERYKTFLPFINQIDPLFYNKFLKNNEEENLCQKENLNKKIEETNTNKKNDFQENLKKKAKNEENNYISLKFEEGKKIRAIKIEENSIKKIMTKKNDSYKIKLDIEEKDEIKINNDEEQNFTIILEKNYDDSEIFKIIDFLKLKSDLKNFFYIYFENPNFNLEQNFDLRNYLVNLDKENKNNFLRFLLSDEKMKKNIYENFDIFKTFFHKNPIFEEIIISNDWKIFFNLNFEKILNQNINSILNLISFLKFLIKKNNKDLIESNIKENEKIFVDLLCNLFSSEFLEYRKISIKLAITLMNFYHSEMTFFALYDFDPTFKNLINLYNSK